VLKPGGTRYLYADANNGYSLYESDLDGGNIVLVAGFDGTDATYSPDGSQIAFLLNDPAQNCSHVHVAATDGSQSTAPPMIRDCGVSGEFITALDWIARP
jgi:Tol biopolymer transport system component